MMEIQIKYLDDDKYKEIQIKYLDDDEYKEI